jgi:hypothetical protein
VDLREPEEVEELRSLARPLRRTADLDGLVERLGPDHFVCLPTGF